ncbi:MAG TPA: 8-amino-7-oxononanoate synthase [Rhodocyclaceae bacterium]|nr:8-amino-7-oxononanoate synthase [Rhodocyclaceae bacterium]
MRLLDTISDKLEALARQNLRRRVRTVETPCSPHIRIDDRELLAFCSNDYLGLANHPALVEAMAAGARRYGVGSGAAHLVSGHSRAHALLEEQLASMLSPWIPEARALFFCTGYMANLAVTPAMVEAGDTASKRSGRAIFADALNHASLIDAARLARDAELIEYPHADLATLESVLKHSSAGHKLIVTDAVFSMDGDIAPLPALAQLAEHHDAWLIVDDAHGFGVLGENGCGALEHFDLRSERIVYTGTLGKAAGVAGAFVVAHASVIDWLLQRARTYLFTTAAPPAVAHTVSRSLELIAGSEGRQRRAALHANIRHFKSQLQTQKWSLLPSATAIQPLLIGSNGATLAAAQSLDQAGLWVPAIRPPTVPAGTARLRIALSAAHAYSDIDRLCSALATAEQEAN